MLLIGDLDCQAWVVRGVMWCGVQEELKSHQSRLLNDVLHAVRVGGGVSYPLCHGEKFVHKLGHEEVVAGLYSPLCTTGVQHHGVVIETVPWAHAR